MKSKKLLFIALDKFFSTTEFGELNLKHKKISNETYGRNSCIYVHTDSPVKRRELERFLKNNGFKVDPDYWPSSGTAEVSVSYFRGDNWAE